MVTVIAVSGAVLASLTSSSLKKLLLEATTGVTVTPPPPVAVVTVRETFVVWLTVPLVPVTVIVAAPKVAVLEAVKVRTLLVPVVVVVCGLKPAVTPVGNPLAVKATVLANPFNRVIVIVLVPLALRATVKLAGLAEREKSGIGGT